MEGEGEGAAAALFRRLKRKRAKEGEERAFALAPISVIVVVAAASSVRVRVPRMGPSLVHSPLEIRSPSRYQDVPRIGGWRRRTANGNGAGTGRQTPGVEDQCDRISGAVEGLIAIVQILQD